MCEATVGIQWSRQQDRLSAILLEAIGLAYRTGGFESPLRIDNTMNHVESKSRSGLTRLIVFGIVVALIATLYTQFSDQLTLENLATQESALRDFQQRHPVLIYGFAFLLYVTVTGLSLPGAAGLTLSYGWYFGLVPAFILVSFASTTGATVAFLLSRYLFRETIQRKFGDRLSDFNQSLEDEGAFYLFTLRLIPAVPFFVINVVMGLTPMRVWTYWWISQVGMLAGTFVYVYAGSSVPDLNTLAQQGTSGILSPQMFVAFAILGLFPLVVKKTMQRLRKQPIAE